MDKIFQHLKELQNGGARHRTLVQELRNAKHQGCDVSEDSTMIVAYFEDGVIIVAPYGVITKVKRG
jgi:hypothetical protein